MDPFQRVTRCPHPLRRHVFYALRSEQTLDSNEGSALFIALTSARNNAPPPSHCSCVWKRPMSRSSLHRGRLFCVESAKFLSRVQHSLRFLARRNRTGTNLSRPGSRFLSGLTAVPSEPTLRSRQIWSTGEQPARNTGRQARRVAARAPDAGAHRTPRPDRRHRRRDVRNGALQRSPLGT